MSKLVLILNCGSSSLKFAILDPATGEEKLSGLAEAFYLPEARIKWKLNGEKGSADLGAGAAHTEALNFIASNIMTDELKNSITSIGHRIVHGGEKYTQSVVVTDEVVKAREDTVFLTNEYNASFGQPAEVREVILKKLLKSIGKGVHFEPNFRCEFGYNISIGNNFYANFDCIMLDGGGIEIGDNVLFGPRVGIYTSNHATDAWERVHGACYAKPVKIGNNVWIGAGVHINQGVTIGDNTIIGSGSVVTKNIPSNVVAAGVPCKVIREITEADKTEYRP